MRKKEKKNKTKVIVAIPIAIILIGTICLLIGYKLHKNKLKEQEEKQINLVKSYYNDVVVTNKETELFVLKDNKFKSGGYIDKDTVLKLIESTSNYKEGYFKIENLKEEYYIYYEDVDKQEEEPIYNERHKNYIPYNKNIITNKTFSLYDSNNKVKYVLSHSEEFPIIINQKDFYGVVFDNQLLYIKAKDIKDIIDASNAKLTNAKEIPVLNYHAVYNPNIDNCNTIVCHTETQFKSHLEYIKSNKIFTPTLKELEMYLDGQIQLPKSVVITLDDGWHSLEAAALLNQYELTGTVFVITSEYNPKTIESKYVEVHSHTHNMHKLGDCPKGQGGGIQCLNEQYIQEDLKKSRDRLNNTTYFCYPFYEYNNYSINQLKKAGFTTAFAGYNANGPLKAKPGIDKFQIPRYVIYSYTTLNQLKQYIG